MFTYDTCKPNDKRHVNTDLPPLKSGEHKINNIERATNLNLGINNLHVIYMILCVIGNDSMDRDYKYNWDEMIRWFFILMNIR